MFRATGQQDENTTNWVRFLKYSKGFFNHSDNSKRKPVAGRRFATPKSTGAVRRKSSLSIGLKSLFMPAAFLAALGCGWGILALVQTIQTKDARIPWHACLESQEKGAVYPSLIEIPVGSYDIPNEASPLTPFLQFHAKPNFVLENRFLIQNREVDQEQFRRYADYVEGLQDFNEKQRLRLRMGEHWSHSDAQDSLVRHVSWEGAMDYAQWLSKKTGCDYRLPYREEWAVAAIYLSSLGKSVINGSVDPEGVVKSILSGTREWSQSPCPDGYYLLGGDDWIATTDDRKEICMPAILAMAGFRLVLNPSNVPGSASGDTPGHGKNGDSLKMAPALTVEKK